MVFLAVFTGLRVGELLGLKWKDIDFQKMEIHVIRSIVMQHVGDCKTEAFRKPVPLDLRLSKVCGTGDCKVHIQSTRTGCSRAHPAKASCRTGQVRSTRRTSNRHQGSRNRGPLRLARVPTLFRLPDYPGVRREYARLSMRRPRFTRYSWCFPDKFHYQEETPDENDS
jgi:hypothetical protein